MTNTITTNIIIQCRRCGGKKIKVTKEHYDNCREFDIFICPECLELGRMENEEE